MAASEKLQFLITADGKTAIKTFQDVGNSAEKDLGKVDKTLDKVGGTLTKAGAGAVAFAGIAGTAIVKTVSSFNDLAIEAGKMADAIGLPVDEASRWIEVAGDVGVETNTITGAMQKFNKAVADGKPSLEQYGVEIAKTKDGVVDANQSFINAIDTIGKIEDPTKRAQAAQELFGRSYGEIAELIEMGAGNVQQALADVSDTKVIDQEELDDARAYREAMDSLGDAAQDLTLAIGQGATPVVAGFADAAAKAIGFVSSLDGVTNGAVGRFAALGTVGVGTIGTLSLIAGQAIKLRDRFTVLGADGVRSLTAMGKAASAAGGAITGIGVALAAIQIIDSFRDSVDDTTKELQAFQNQAGKVTDDLGPMLFAFQDLAQAQFDNANTMSQAASVYGSAFDQTKVNAESMNKAFEQVLATSPQMAQQIIDAMMAVSAEVNNGNEKAQEFAEYWGLSADVVFDWQKRVDDASGAQAALTGEVEGGTTAADLYAKAVGGATKNTEGYVSAADRAKAITEAWDQKWDMLTGSLSAEEAWINLQQQFDAVRQKGADAFAAVEDGTLDATVAARDQRGEVIGLTQDTATYLQEILKIPPERATEIIADLNQGHLDEALMKIATLEAEIEKPRTMPVTVSVKGGEVVANLGGGRTARAGGGVVQRGETTLVGEQGPELAVFPPGTQIIPNSQTEQILNGAAATTTNIHMGPTTINQLVDADLAIQRVLFALAS